MDMGARRYDLNTGRFLQQDMFQSAFADLALSVDPLAQNLYALAGGNPVSNVEFDGHHARRENGGRGTTRGGRSPRSSSSESTSESSGGDADSGVRRSARRGAARDAADRDGSERRDGFDKAKSALGEISGPAGRISSAAKLGQIGVESATRALSGKFREAAKRPSSNGMLRGRLGSARSKAYDWVARKTEQMGGKIGGDLGKVSKAAGSVAKLTGTTGSIIEGVDGARQQWREDEDRKDLTGVEKGLRAGVRGVAEGGGSAVGGAVGGTARAAAGTALCGPACGVVGGVVGSDVGSRVGAAAGDVAGGDAVEAGGDVVEAVGDVL